MMPSAQFICWKCLEVIVGEVIPGGLDQRRDAGSLHNVSSIFRQVSLAKSILVPTPEVLRYRCGGRCECSIKGCTTKWNSFSSYLLLELIPLNSPERPRSCPSFSDKASAARYSTARLPPKSKIKEHGFRPLEETRVFIKALCAAAPTPSLACSALPYLFAHFLQSGDLAASTSHALPCLILIIRNNRRACDHHRPGLSAQRRPNPSLLASLVFAARYLELDHGSPQHYAPASASASASAQADPSACANPCPSHPSPSSRIKLLRPVSANPTRLIPTQSSPTPHFSEGSHSQLPVLAFRQDSRRSLLAGDPGFSEQQSTYAQYPQYSQQPPAQQPQYVESFPQMAAGSRSGRGSASLARSTADLFKKKWPRAFFLVGVVQLILCIAFESYTFAKFNSSLKDMTQAPYSTDEKVQSQLKTIPTFLALFIFGFLYELVLVWDALRVKNTIQVIGVCIANLALMVYTSIQVDQIDEAVTILITQNAVEDLTVWNDVKGILIAIPCIIGVGTICFSFVAWKLYQEFAWDILKHIGADYRMKKRFLHYQIYIALLKFDFFFFIGFTIQFLVVVGGMAPAEFGLTCAAIPITVAILLCAAWFTRREWKWGMVFIIVLYLGALAYFIFKLSRIYDPVKGTYYLPVKKSMTAFAVITIILIVITIVNCLVCTLNFGAGLKQHLQSAPQRGMDKDQASYSMGDVKQSQLPSRMTID
ncbi:hypothetical protein SCAR479_05911 [Seiridium cardinale]|uniref:Uncharacterized protein n=1 Tax=Seiridium cardinale TaxID=138064 RepID=A0ABR2XUN6_9PEZI